MTRDFAKPSTTREPDKRPKERSSGKKKPPSANSKKPQKNTKMSKSSPNILIILACAAIISASAAGLYLLNKVPPTKSTTVETTTTTPEPKKLTPTTEPEVKERFKFYDLLPESEVIPPKVDAYQYKEKGKEIQFEYILQTGSFRSPDDAERQRAMIGFQGLKARVEKVDVNESSTWYRVQVGPFTSRSKMNSAMDKLVAINIQPLVKKNKR